MANKKVVTATDSNEPPKNSESYVKSRIEEYLGEPMDEKPEIEEKTEDVEEVVKEAPVEEKDEVVAEAPVEPLKVVEEPPLDPEKLKEEVRSQVRADIIKELGLTKEEAKKYTFPWEAENRNPANWEELTEVTAQIASQMTLKSIEDKRLAEQAALEEQRQQETEIVKQQEVATQKYHEDANREWDRQLDVLRERGLLPKIANKSDANDPGIKANNDFWKQILDVNTQLMNEGKPIVTNLVEFHSLYYKPRSAEPKGASAPVMGATTTASTSEGPGYDYDEIRKARNYEDLL